MAQGALTEHPAIDKASHVLYYLCGLDIQQGTVDL
jgi:hypothetical protein